MILPKKMNFSILPTRRPADEVYYMKDKPSKFMKKQTMPLRREKNEEN